MKLVDLKRTDEDKEDEAEETASIAESQPDYGYGLCIRLEDGELEKLGITQMPKLGDEFHIMAAAFVKSVNQVDYGERKERQIELQITMMGVEKESPHAGEERETSADEAKEMRRGAKTVMHSTYMG